MRIHLDFKGVPILYKTMNKQKEIDVDWTPATGTVKELVTLLARRFGAAVNKALLDASGNIDQEIRVVLNQSNDERPRRKLRGLRFNSDRKRFSFYDE